MPRGYRKPYRKLPGHSKLRGKTSTTLRQPPTPPPCANPHFLVTEYAHSWEGDTLYVACVTDVACHLFLRWTAVPMGMHNRSTTLGGYTFETDPKYCLVQYNEVEQNEAGDTLSHTFDFGGWADCETRWWYIVGTINGNPSPSVTCIFQAHYLDQEEAESLKHTDLIEKEVAGVIDHADLSVTAAKLEADLDGQPGGLNADKVDGLHASEIPTSLASFYASLGQYYEWNLDSIDGFYQVAILGASITLEWYRLHVQTGGANLADVVIRKYLDAPGRLMTWDKTRRMICRLKWVADTFQDSYLLIGTDIGNPHVGWVLDDEKLYASRKAAGAQSLTYIQDIVANTVYNLEVIHVPGDKVYWEIDGAPVYNSAVAQPSGTVHAQRPWAFRLYATQAVNKRAEITGFRFVQEP